MALQVAREVAPDYRGGAAFVDLSLVASEEFVAPAIASAVEAVVAPDEDAFEYLQTLFERRSMLLVIDNCEHVRNAAARAIAVLLRCPNLRIVATSRETFPQVDVGSTYRLPMLRVDDARALFLERARAARRDFIAVGEEAAAVDSICAAVDYIALGIELAAARIAVVSPVALLERLRANLTSMSSGRRASSDRHQTVEKLIDWSYGLLDAREQRVFRRLGAFVGGWSLDAASAVCSLDDLDPFEVFDVHASLIEKSLVTELGDGRYRLLEPVRAFAIAKLAENGENDVAASAHLQHFCTRAREADERFYTSPSREWFGALTQDIENYRAAVGWALRRGHDRERGAALVGSLMWYLYYMLPAEGVQWARTSLSAEIRDASTEARIWLGLTPLYLLPAVEKREAGERALNLYRRLNEPSRLAHALRLLGLTLAWYFPEERLRAAELIEEALAIVRQLGDTIGTALVLQAQSQVLPHDARTERRKLQEEALALLREAGNDRQLSVVLTDLSEGAFAEGDEALALRYGREALRVAEASGSRNTIMVAAANLSHYAAAAADIATTRDVCALILRYAHESQSHEFITYAVHAMAILFATIGELERAALLFGFCNARYGTLHTPRHHGMSEDVLYRRSIARVQCGLGEERTATLLGRGTETSELQAIELAQGAATPL